MIFIKQKINSYKTKIHKKNRRFLLQNTILFVKLVHWFFFSCNWSLFMELVVHRFFVHRTFCVLISVFEICCILNLSLSEIYTLIFFFSPNWFRSWNFLRVDLYTWNLFQVHGIWNFLYIDFSPHETDFVHGTCNVLIFVHETSCILIFLFVKLVRWSFSSWNWFCSWNSLCADFCSWDLLQVDISLRETCLMLNFLYVELIVIDFSHRKTDFAQ